MDATIISYQLLIPYKRDHVILIRNDIPNTNVNIYTILLTEPISGKNLSPNEIMLAWQKISQTKKTTMSLGVLKNLT